MAHLQVKVVNTLGTFEGKITLAANATHTDATNVMKDLIGGINSLELLSIESDKGDATIFGQDVLRSSVVTIRAEG